MAAQLREIREIDAAIRGIELSMDSALVHLLSLHVPAVRRIAGLKQKSTALVAQLALLRREVISSRARSKLAESLARTLVSAELRKDSELESLETTTIFAASSLRQAVDD